MKHRHRGIKKREKYLQKLHQNGILDQSELYERSHKKRYTHRLEQELGWVAHNEETEYRMYVCLFLPLF